MTRSASQQDVLDRVRVLRSKNAGPYVVTLDIVLKEQSDFEALRRGLSADLVAEAYSIDAARVESFDFFDELLAAKISIKRRKPCGHPGDPDCYAMNQEQPLAWLLQQVL